MSDRDLVEVGVGGLPAPAAALESWQGASTRAIAAKKERDTIVKSILKKDLDFGTIPGTNKPTLYKAGAEKVCDALQLWPDFEQVRVVEDFDRPLFHYVYRCLLRHRGTNFVVASGIGSCNSMEKKYRYRAASRVCPKCKGEFIIKGKEEFGGGWLCFARKGGCGAKFPDGDQAIEGQKAGQVENDDIFSQINTIDKIAQKRASVAATLNFGFSEYFTQDLDDLGDGDDTSSSLVQTPQPTDGAAAPVDPGSVPESVPPEGTEPAKPAKSTGGMSWSGVLKEVKIIKSKPGADKVWVMHVLKVEGEEDFVTFDKTVAATAIEADKRGLKVRVDFSFDQKGKRRADNVVFLEV